MQRFNLFEKLPKIIDLHGRTTIQLQEEIINVSMSHELAYLLGFVNQPTKGESLIMIQNTSKHALLSSHQRHPMVEFSIIFLYCDLIEYQSVENQKASLLRIMPADENDTSQVETIQFEHLYYYRIRKDIISHIIPEIRSEFGELIQVCRSLIRVSFSTYRLWSSINRSQQERPFSTNFVHYSPDL